MKPPEDRSVRQPADNRTAAPDEAPEELTEERTVEWDVEQMDAQLLEAGAETPSPGSGRAIVDGPIEDENSAGARSPRELTARRQRRDTVPSLVSSVLAKSMRSGPPAGRPRDLGVPAMRQADVTRQIAIRDDAVPIERDSGAYSVELASRATNVHTAPTAESPVPTLDPVAMLVDRIPVINRSELELDGLTLNELGWSLLRRLDGRSTLGQVFAATKIPRAQALQIAASLLRDGVIRIEGRAAG